MINSIMKIYDLFETTEEDRALASLAASIYTKLVDLSEYEPDYTDEEQGIIQLGKIGELFNTPITILNNITIEMQDSESMIDRLNLSRQTPLKGPLFGMFDAELSTIVFNMDYLSTPKMKTTVIHELRHALDELKSNSFPGNAKKYFTPKHKKHRKVYKDPADTRNRMAYLAQPAEINARFAELLDSLTRIIPKRIDKFGIAAAKNVIYSDLFHLLDKYEIAAIYPEKSKSPAYKRLVNRAYDFIEKELSYLAQSM